jgi:hypothetical protein
MNKKIKKNNSCSKWIRGSKGVATTTKDEQEDQEE